MGQLSLLYFWDLNGLWETKHAASLEQYILGSSFRGCSLFVFAVAAYFCNVAPEAKHELKNNHTFMTLNLIRKQDPDESNRIQGDRRFAQEADVWMIMSFQTKSTGCIVSIDLCSASSTCLPEMMKTIQDGI